ncbi:MAG: hypothetical protein AAB504_03420 [Patescibacteria group bacterium]
MENNSQNSDIEIRTMKSDIAAVKASGGDATSMQFIKLSKDKKPVAVEETKINIGVPGYVGPEQGIFASTGEVGREAGAQQSSPQKFSIKTIIIVVISILAIAGLGYLAYNIALKVF